MQPNHVILAMGIVIWMTLVHNYTDMDYLPTATRCSATLDLCVACPHLPSISKNPLTQHQQIYAETPFYVLAVKNQVI
jgi:hypothetical protein